MKGIGGIGDSFIGMEWVILCIALESEEVIKMAQYVVEMQEEKT